MEGLRKRYLETESQVEGWRTRWEYGGAIWVKGSRPSPAHPTLEVPLAITAVRSLELGVAAVTVTHCVQLHSQLLREATGSEPQQMRLWEAVGSLESNPKIHRLVDSDLVALYPVASFTQSLLRIPTLRFIRDADPRREKRVFVFEGHSG